MDNKRTIISAGGNMTPEHHARLMAREMKKPPHTKKRKHIPPVDPLRTLVRLTIMGEVENEPAPGKHNDKYILSKLSDVTLRYISDEREDMDIPTAHERKQGFTKISLMSPGEHSALKAVAFEKGDT
jgi:hypothetical protein